MVHPTAERPRKRIFLGLALVSLLVASASTWGLWFITRPGLSQISVYLPILIGIVLLAAIAALGFGVLGSVLAVMGVPMMRFVQGLVWWALNLLFPLIMVLGRIFDIDRNRVERSFIEVSNQIIRLKKLHFRPEKVLILTPHCLQLNTCGHRITQQVERCRGCGMCPVGGLLALSRKYGVHLSVVPGGTLARRVIKSIRPQVVLAVACERDLVSGIQDVFPLPVIGVLNERPEGPCFNTRIDLARVEEVLIGFVGKDCRKTT